MNLTKKSILLLEDEKEQSSALSEILIAEGYDDVETDTTESALKTLESYIPELIIADLKLPDIDCMEFLKDVKKNKFLQKVPFIFLSAMSGLDFASEAKNYGASDYITKPYDIEYLMARIRELISLK